MNRHQRRAHASRTRKHARKDIRKVNARLKNEQAAPEFVTGIDPAHGEDRMLEIVRIVNAKEFPEKLFAAAEKSLARLEKQNNKAELFNQHNPAREDSSKS